MKSFEKHRAVICKVRFTQNNNRAVKPSLFVDASSLQAVKPTLLRVKLGYKAEKMEKKSGGDGMQRSLRCQRGP